MITIHQAFNAIRQLVDEVQGLQWVSALTEPKFARGSHPAGLVTIRFKGKKIDLVVEILSSGEPRFIAQGSSFLMQAMEQHSGCPLLIAPFIGKRGRSLCQELGMGFLDLAGNASLRYNGLLIDRWGKGSAKREERTLRNLFSTKATWVIRVLLNEPERRWTLSELSRGSLVSIGMVHRVMKRLMNEGFVEMTRGAGSLVKPGELLDAWAEVYRYQDHTIVGYYCPQKSQIRILDSVKDLPGTDYALTLGAGASLVAPFVRSHDVNVYIRSDEGPVVKALDLTPVEFGGNVYLIQPVDAGVFMGGQRIKGMSVVSNIQLYLDLYQYPMRGREQANHLREKILEI